MPTITVTETINAPQAEVFDLASDIPGAAARISGIDKVEILAEAPPAPTNRGPVGKGFSWRETRTMMGKKATEDMTITEWSPPNAYTVEARSHGCHYRTPITLEPLDANTTRITMSFNATAETTAAKIMMKLFAFMNKQIAKALQKDLADIKQAAQRPR